MKQVFSLGGSIVVEDIDAPICEDNTILVMNAYSAISVGTEKTTISKKQESSLIKRLLKKENLRKGFAMVREKGLKHTLSAVQKTSTPILIPLGYSTAGKVIAVGKNVTNFSPGDLVACAGGGFATHAEIVEIPKNLVCKIPENVSLKEASLTTLGAIALQGIRRAKPTLGETFVVTGLGLLGQLTCQMLSSAGIKVIALDLIDARLEIAKKNGAELVLNPTKGDIEQQIMKFTHNIGADGVIICAATQSSEPVHQAMRVSRKKGRIIIVGAVGMELERSLMYEKELDFFISTSYGPGRYDSKYEADGNDYPIGYVRWTENRNMQAFLELLAVKKINLANIIEYEFPVEEAEQAFAIVREKSPLGIVLKYDDNIKNIETIKRKTVLISTEKPKEFLKVAIIGAGSFAKGKHIPNILKIPNTSLEAIVDKMPTNARNSAQQYKARISSTDYKELLNENIDLAIITTRHDTHAEMAKDFAEHGVNILVEKPLALTLKDAEDVVKAVKKNNVNLIVGFNRRFSPLSQIAKQAVQNRTSPIMMTIRVNSAGMTNDHWINDPIKGGGAILGEGCHFYDYCNWLIGSEPIEFSASMITSAGDTILDQNNIISTMKYQDGSVASVIYTTIGNQAFPKERIEIFNDGLAIAIDDFKDILIEGSDLRSKSLENIEKGHFEMLEAYVKFLRGERDSKDLPLIDEAFLATKCALRILEEAKKNYKGEK
ncbi:MAG: bi-domain-containing oxidoreductase [Candidatus Thorarchaeota archaeon]